MPSVRDKIEAFESISKKDNEDPPRESGKGPPKSNSILQWLFIDK